MLVGFLHGFVVRQAVLGDGDAEAFRNGLRAIAPGPQAAVS
jgi:hypothetical protein